MIDSPGSGVSAVVLAGGRSSRFGGDKLGADVGGRPLLERAIDGVSAVARDVVVVLAPGDGRSVGGNVRTVADPEPHGGPLVGLAAGLEVAAESIVVVAGGDMPSLDRDVIELMVRTLVAAGEGTDAVVLVQRSRIAPLPAVMRTGAASDVVTRLVADGERSLRALFEHLPTRRITEDEWRPLDPEARTLRDVDRPSDV
ncbi:MAG TPA: molybdenum cofactor guanylyltransferase [Candidatus Limnocylindrales bacterium]|nr:molybdenum cofactor guanylyltransferase [Candidatus Limnocylindrales bacterium]